MSKTYSFKAQHKAGDLGEIIFGEANPHLLRLDGFKGDYQDPSTGLKYELKTDSWNMNRTPNIFIERFSNQAKQSPGGIWQAQEHGAAKFVYMFSANLTYFTFDTSALIGRVELLAPGLEVKQIANKSYTTMGYLVPRSSVMDLAEVTQLTVVKKPPCS